MPFQFTSTYLISSSQTDFSFESDSTLAKVKSNFSGTRFVVTDEKSSKQLHTQLVSINYLCNCCEDIHPREMNVVLRHQKTSNANTKIKEAEFIELQSKKPEWDEKSRTHQLKFNNKIKRSSVKNFILVLPGEPNSQKMLFGKVTTDTYAMDIVYPLTLMQAFAIALSSCDPKLLIQ